MLVNVPTKWLEKYDLQIVLSNQRRSSHVNMKIIVLWELMPFGLVFTSVSEELPVLQLFHL